MMTEPLKIALVDDHRLFRSGIAALINHLEGYCVVFEAANGKELMDKMMTEPTPDIIILDMYMPVMDGAATAKLLREVYPQISIIVVSMLEDAEGVLAMFKLGIKGYLLKDSEPDEFEQALKKVSHGEIYYPGFIARLLLDNANHHSGPVKLLRRELEFLKYAGTELTYKEIAEKMKISVRTVDGYRDTLFDKLHVKNRVGLVLYAVKNKLIDL